GPASIARARNLYLAALFRAREQRSVGATPHRAGIRAHRGPRPRRAVPPIREVGRRRHQRPARVGAHPSLAEPARRTGFRPPRGRGLTSGRESTMERTVFPRVRPERAGDDSAADDSAAPRRLTVSIFSGRYTRPLRICFALSSMWPNPVQVVESPDL